MKLKSCFLVRDPLTIVNGGSSETLEPTVKVWMGEELREFLRCIKIFFKIWVLILLFDVLKYQFLNLQALSLQTLGFYFM
ncbi:hypothetical protein WQ54_06220 [Bacillus sp. SA1-12]|nr:hypothetical protein WQ54_06220 [Bacillus sp. SA1-12]